MTSNMKIGDSPAAMDKSFLLKLELFDGTSQIVQLTEEQAVHLGINIAENGPGSFINPVTNDVQNFQQFIDTVQDNLLPEESNVNESEVSHNYMYKILKPEDLDLKPITTTHVPRGRPRKRPSEQVPQEPPKTVKEPQVVIKQVRTRSGRITKPPRYIGQDFRVIDTSDDSRYDAELKTTEFEPLSTNETPTLEPHVHLQQHSRKRKIPSHYRCPTCKKAYLGKMKILNHFNKYPDHGPVPTFCKMKHNATWNFLVLTTQKFKQGSKGVKFCQELTVLLENARILAKFLFKPVENGETGYFVDDYLAHVFGIVPGDYILNESELHKDASLYAFLEKKCMDDNKSGSEEISIDKTDIKTDSIRSRLRQNDDFSSLNMSSAIKQNIQRIEKKSKIDLHRINFPSHVETIEDNLRINHLDVPLNENNCDQHFLQQNNGNNRSALVKYNMQPKQDFLLNNHDFDHLNNQLVSVLDSAEGLSNYHMLSVDDNKTSSRLAQICDHNKISKALTCDDKCNDYDIEKHIVLRSDLLSQVNDLMLDNVNATVDRKHCSALHDRNIIDKKLGGYDVDKHSLDNVLLSHVDELMLENVNGTEHKQNSTLDNQIEIPKKHQCDIKKNNDYDIDKHMRLHNELLSHVDLILENVDTGQVSNLLDTSSNSDDIMNVDQFVNERFKKLTEPDMELQNTSLNLDLPPLDMFNFHTS